MRVVSVNTGQPKVLSWKGRHVRTAIFKEPVSGSVRVRKLGLEGDHQADLSVHGGPRQAVYAYPSEHYEFWRPQLGLELPWGAFGENLTLRGLLEETVHLGDQYRMGSALLQVTKPRAPCHKLAAKFGRDDILELFRESRRWGFYLAVLEEGEIAADDTIMTVHQNVQEPTVSAVVSHRLRR